MTRERASPLPPACSNAARRPILAWLALTAAVVLLPTFTMREGLGSTGSVLPIALALLVCGLWRWRLPVVPPGDLVVPLYNLIASREMRSRRPAAGAVPPAPRSWDAWPRSAFDRTERRLAGPRAVTILFVSLLFALAVAAAFRAAP